MPWKCYNCGTKNLNSEDACSNCGGNVAAPKSFYIHWVFGGAAFFLVVYIIGVFVGGTLVELAAAPTEADVLAAAKAADPKVENIKTLKPEALDKAEAAALAKTKSEMSPIFKQLTFWFLPFILFMVCGVIVGFVSDGKTIIEAAIGSVIGQVGGFMILVYAFSQDMSYLALGIGVLPGFGLAMLGAFFGEILQDRKERMTRF